VDKETWRALYAQSSDGWLPTGELRWIERGGDRVLQQKWRTIAEPENVRTEWRFVPVDTSC